MARAYHTWRQDVARMRAAGWELTAHDRGVLNPVATWSKTDSFSGDTDLETDTGPDILAAIRGATQKAIKQLEAEARTAQEKPNE